MIFVTKPFLPPLEEYMVYIQDIWERQWLTNNGPLVNHLELRLKDYLDVKHMLFVNNGTTALQLAIKTLGLTGEIITTPFSFVATTSTIVWESCKPVFVDIDPHSLNIDPEKIEQAITEKTSAILATHVYGNPCAIDSIQAIANKHKLKVIYDGAHCFGTKYKQQSVFNFGDITTVSFHATKIFHTVEGGGIFSPYAEVIRQAALLRNFGFSNVDEIAAIGINGKNSEFHAAMGLANLPYVDDLTQYRKKLYAFYDEKLRELDVAHIQIHPDAEFNYAYYPIIFKSESMLLKNIEELNRNRIYPRRYFYPALSKLPYLKAASTPIAEDIAARVMCLPLYNALSVEEVDFVCRILLRVQNN